jgi:hypothetical protein
MLLGGSSSGFVRQMRSTDRIAGAAVTVALLVRRAMCVKTECEAAVLSESAAGDRVRRGDPDHGAASRASEAAQHRRVSLDRLLTLRDADAARVARQFRGEVADRGSSIANSRARRRLSSPTKRAGGRRRGSRTPRRVFYGAEAIDGAAESGLLPPSRSRPFRP